MGSTTSLQTWLSSNVIPLLVLVVAIVLFAIAGRGDNAKSIRIVVGILIALAVLGLSVGGNAASTGAALWRLIWGA